MSGEEDMRRLEELAVSRLLEPLSTDEALEYAELRRRNARFDEAAIESVIALAHLAVLPQAEPVPRTLRAAVEKDADDFFGNRTAHDPPASKRPVPPRRAFPLRPASWGAALAASVTLAVVLLHRGPAVPDAQLAVHRAPPASVPSMIQVPEAPAPLPPPRTEPPTPVQDPAAGDPTTQWRAFLAAHPHAIERAWRAGGDASGERVGGAVVWDEASQSGFLRFVNLRRNEPNAEQYQLWIFDAGRDQRYPVDGGVFDITSPGGEQIIAIHAKLRVRVPLMFAVTVEHPGGVVVSDRSRIAAIANIT